MPKISVIVPVYNVEQYLRRSLDCLLNQTLEDIEIICIDDCSEDNSLDILNEYKEIDSRFKIIAFSENSGAAAARNAGLEVATGEYLGFMDPDDIIDLNFYEALYNKAKETNVDIAKCYRKNIDLNGEITVKNVNKRIKRYGIHRFTSEWTTAIYKTSIIRENNIRFNSEIIKSQDLLFLNKVILTAKSIEIVENVYYYYYKRENSLHANSISLDKIQSACKSVRLIIEDINNSDLYNEDLKNYISLYQTKFFSLLNTFYQNRSDEASNLCVKTLFDCYDKCKDKNKLKKSLSYNKSILEKLDNHQTKEFIEILNKYNNRTEFSQANNSKRFYKSFWELIFSLKNENNHKVITVGGIKFKIKHEKEYILV